MSDTTSKLTRAQRLQKQKEELEKQLRDANAKDRERQKERETAMDFAVGRALREEAKDNAAVASLIREVVERRNKSNKVRGYFGLKPLAAEQKPEAEKPQSGVRLVKDSETEAA
jgi:phage-related tail protein